MPFGCFGKRKKRDKTAEDLAEKVKANADGQKSAETAAGEEVVTVTRAHSLHASAPNSVEHRHTTIGIQKSATLARYDFLRKSDYANTADRWVALKQQYLNNANGQQQPHHGNGGAPMANGGRRTAQSLPRQFAPPSSSSMLIVGASGRPVRFSQWFYDRQTMETDARKEFHEREEKNRKLLDGITDSVIPEEPVPQQPAASSATGQSSSADTNVAVTSDNQGGTGDTATDSPPSVSKPNSQEAKYDDQPTANHDDNPSAADGEAAAAADRPSDAAGGEVAAESSGSKDQRSSTVDTEPEEATMQQAAGATDGQAESG